MIILLILSLEVQAQMFWNNAGSFNGTSSSYVAVESSSSLDITGGFTLEAWIMPNDVTTPATQIIVGKGVPTLPRYELRLSSSGFPGRVAVRTNGLTRLYSRTAVKSGNWTHVSATFNSSTDVFSIYINGVYDTSATITGAEPITNSDSLLIGKGSNNSFSGMLDEVRIWNRALSGTEILTFMRNTLGTNTGIYNGCVLSITFQYKDATGSAFSLLDWTGLNGKGKNNGVTAVNLSNRPSQTININDCAKLDGTNEYLAAADNNDLSPSSDITLEAWIYPTSFQIKNIIIHKGSDNGLNTNYRLEIYNRKLIAFLNNTPTLSSDDSIPLNQWTHVSFVYNSESRLCYFYINGIQTDTDIFNDGFITNGTDSLYIGGTIIMNDFSGYIDEVRISSYAKTESDINKYLYKSIDQSNDPPGVEVVYNLDGYTVANTLNDNRLFFRNSGGFAGITNDQPVSPINRADNINFIDGFYLKSLSKRLPLTGNIGTTEDTMDIFLNESIYDLNLYVALNHNAEELIKIVLIGPNGDSVVVFNHNFVIMKSDHIITIFDDNADSSIVYRSYVSFAPRIKPLNNINSVFAGKNSSGKWRLVITNNNNGQYIGRIYCWGIQFNNKSVKDKFLSGKALIQGFYNPVTDQMAKDTMRFYLRNITSPYSIKDSSKSYLDTSGNGLFKFTRATLGQLYYIQLKHRNSIETWSSVPVAFNQLTAHMTYDFTSDISKAFGNNEVQVNAGPLRYALYNGDVTQNGLVDLTDNSLIDNDAYNFTTGYVATDLTGNNFVDIGDLAIADNNAFNFVSVIRP